MSEHQDVQIEGRRADSLTLDDMPRLGTQIALAVADGEGVLLDGDSGASHHLNPTAALVAQCLDGATSLAVLCQEMVEEAGVDGEQARTGVLELVRDLGRRGLLAGVRADAAAHDHPVNPTLPVGTPLSGLDGAAGDGSILDDAWLAAGEALVVSWGAKCGFCTRLAPVLAELAPGLAERGIRLLLVTPEAHADVEAQVGDAAAALPVAQTPELPSWLAGLGTPVAYATGPGGLTRAPMAHGGIEVTALATALAAGEPLPGA